MPTVFVKTNNLFFKSLNNSITKLQAPRNFSWSSQNLGATRAHSRQKHRQYLGELLLSPPPKINDLVLYYRTVHAQIILSRLESNVFLSNILITAYARGDGLEHAFSVFARMSERNLISWSSIISAFNRNGYYAGALALFSELRRSGDCIPNEFVLGTVIRSWTQLASSENGLYLHSFVIKVGYSQYDYVGSSISDFYAKISDMGAARLAFDELGEKNVVNWTAIMLGFSMNGRNGVSIDLFKKMVGSGVVPDTYALSCLLRACSMLEAIELGEQVHAFVLRNGFNMDISIANFLIYFYSKCGELKAGRGIFDQMGIKNASSWELMISSCTRSRLDYEAINLFVDMKRLGWKADGSACTSILTSCGSLGALYQGEQVHAYAVKANLDSDDSVANSLIDMYCNCDSLIDARRVFLASAMCSVVPYNTMIEGYSRQESLYQSLVLFSEMRQKLIQPSSQTFISLLGVSASQDSLQVSQQVHCLMIKFGFCLESSGGSTLMDVYLKSSLIGNGRLAFEEIYEKDIVVWNSMLFGLVTHSRNEEAINLFMELCYETERPNASTFVAVIMASSNLTSLIHGVQFHDQTIKIGLDHDMFVTNALMVMYSNCGSIESAQVQFDSMPQRDVACWNSLISIHSQHGNAEKALETFTRMKSSRVIIPNHITFIGVLSACAHVGLVEEGFLHFSDMLELGIEPSAEHYTSMVSLLGRAGRLHEAKSFIEGMPMQPTPLTWKSLLSACRVAGDVELGQYAAEMAVSYDPSASGPYILLSNIFASKGMWTEVKKLREKMNKNDVVKETGLSWIEINEQVHVFAARDEIHQQVDLIYPLIDHLMQHMKVDMGVSVGGYRSVDFLSVANF